MLRRVEEKGRLWAVLDICCVTGCGRLALESEARQLAQMRREAKAMDWRDGLHGVRSTYTVSDEGTRLEAL